MVWSWYLGGIGNFSFLSNATRIFSLYWILSERGTDQYSPVFQSLPLNSYPAWKHSIQLFFDQTVQAAHEFSIIIKKKIYIQNISFYIFFKIIKNHWYAKDLHFLPSSKWWQSQYQPPELTIWCRVFKIK